MAGVINSTARFAVCFEKLLPNFAAKIELMLVGSLTEHDTGVDLYGDYFDLENLYDVIHKLAAGFPENAPENTLLMDLAYEVRKAKQDGRHIKELRPYPDEQPILYRGSSILLPYFIVQVATLREMLPSFLGDEDIYAAVFALQALLKKALLSKDAEKGSLLYEWCHQYPFRANPHWLQLLDLAVADFLASPLKKRVPYTMKCLHRYFADNNSRTLALKQLAFNAEQLGCSVEQLDVEWPEITW